MTEIKGRKNFTGENTNSNVREGNKWITKSKRIQKSTQMGITKTKTDANGRPKPESPREDDNKD